MVHSGLFCKFQGELYGLIMNSKSSKSSSMKRDEESVLPYR